MRIRLYECERREDVVHDFAFSRTGELLTIPLDNSPNSPVTLFFMGDTADCEIQLMNPKIHQITLTGIVFCGIKRGASGSQVPFHDFYWVCSPI